MSPAFFDKNFEPDKRPHFVGDAATPHCCEKVTSSILNASSQIQTIRLDWYSICIYINQ